MFKMFKKYIQKLIEEEIKKINPIKTNIKKEEEIVFFNRPEIEAAEYIKLSMQRTAKDLKPLNQYGIAMDGIDDNVELQKAFNFNQPVNSIIFTHFARQGFIGYQACALLSQNWLINKCCCIPTEDAIRVDYNASFTTEDILEEYKEILNEIKTDADDSKKFNIKGVCKQFSNNKRIFGFGLCVPLVEDVDMSLPFNIDAIQDGNYHGLAVIDPYWVEPQFNTESQSNPASKDFYCPTWYAMPNGKLIHKSWFVWNTYGTVPDILKPTYFFGGYPLTQLLYERVFSAEKVANEAYMLTMSKRLLVMDGNLNAFLINQKKAEEQIKMATYMRDNFGALIKDRESTVSQIDTSLADFDTVLMSQLQLCCSIADVPTNKILNTQPKGFNSSGDYETKQYNTLLAGIQENDFVPIYSLHFKLLMKSKYNLVKDFDIKFKSIDVPTEKEMSEINNIKADYYTKLQTLGAISGEEVRDNLVKDPQSGFNNLSGEIEEENENYEENEEEVIQINKRI